MEVTQLTHKEEKDIPDDIVRRLEERGISSYVGKTFSGSATGAGGTSERCRRVKGFVII